MTSAWILRAALCIAAVYAWIWCDSAWRARHALKEMQERPYPHGNPSRFAAELESRYTRESSHLDAQRASGRMGAAEYRKRLELLRLELETRKREGPARETALRLKTFTDLYGAGAQTRTPQEPRSPSPRPPPSPAQPQQPSAQLRRTPPHAR